MKVAPRKSLIVAVPVKQQPHTFESHPALMIQVPHQTSEVLEEGLAVVTSAFAGTFIPVVVEELPPELEPVVVEVVEGEGEGEGEGLGGWYAASTESIH